MAQINAVYSKEYTNTNFHYTPTTAIADGANPNTFSIYLISGNATFTGGGALQGVASSAINLQVGVALNLGTNNVPIGAFNIDCTTGIYQIVATYQSSN